MTRSGDLVIESLELVAELVDDPAPAVYELLFARNPEFEPLFALDPSGAIRRNMLQVAVIALMDYVEGREPNMVRSERMNHSHTGVPGPQFDEFYGVVRDAFRGLIEAQWSSATQDAWTEAIEGLTRHTS
jgi:hemoglobin-like flavoprotein